MLFDYNFIVIEVQKEKFVIIQVDCQLYIYIYIYIHILFKITAVNICIIVSSECLSERWSIITHKIHFK